MHEPTDPHTTVQRLLAGPFYAQNPRRARSGEVPWGFQRRPPPSNCPPGFTEYVDLQTGEHTCSMRRPPATGESLPGGNSGGPTVPGYPPCPPGQHWEQSTSKEGIPVARCVPNKPKGPTGLANRGIYGSARTVKFASTPYLVNPANILGAVPGVPAGPTGAPGGPAGFPLPDPWYRDRPRTEQPPGPAPDPTDLRCPPGTRLVGGKCVPVKELDPSGGGADGGGADGGVDEGTPPEEQCPPGYVLLASGECVPPEEIPTPDPGCPPGFVKDDQGNCVELEDPTVPDGALHPDQVPAPEDGCCFDPKRGVLMVRGAEIPARAVGWTRVPEWRGTPLDGKYVVKVLTATGYRGATVCGDHGFCCESCAVGAPCEGGCGDSCSCGSQGSRHDASARFPNPSAPPHRGIQSQQLSSRGMVRVSSTVYSTKKLPGTTVVKKQKDSVIIAPKAGWTFVVGRRDAAGKWKLPRKGYVVVFKDYHGRPVGLYRTLSKARAASMRRKLGAAVHKAKMDYVRRHSGRAMNPCGSRGMNGYTVVGGQLVAPYFQSPVKENPLIAPWFGARF